MTRAVGADVPVPRAAPPACYLGIDLGTSGLKLTLVGPDTVIGEAEAPYPVHTPRPGHAETAPADWARALNRACAELQPLVNGHTRPAAVGVTGQMHGVVLADRDGQPLRPAVLWPDQRAVPLLDAWRALPPQRLGNPVAAGMAGPILSWLRDHEPEAVATAAIVQSPKDWLRSRLTGDRATDRSDATATLLWDVLSDTWMPQALRLAGLTDRQLPDVVASDAVAGTTRRPAAPSIVDAETPVVTGGADTACALAAIRAAAGVADPALVINVGTGIQLLRPIPATALPAASPQLHHYADTDGGWYEMLAIQNGGLALTWAQQQLDVDWNQFLRLAAAAQPGASGAVFVPFLTGERGSLAPPSATAAWSGLTLTTGRPELARAAVEALAFTIRRGVDLLGVHPGPMLLCGGGTRDPFIRQLITDAVGRPLRHIHLRSASAVGAAVLAARGIGQQITVAATVTDLAPAGTPALEAAYDRWLASIR